MYEKSVYHRHNTGTPGTTKNNDSNQKRHLVPFDLFANRISYLRKSKTEPKGCFTKEVDGIFLETDNKNYLEENNIDKEKYG